MLDRPPPKPPADFPSLLGDDDLYYFREGTHTRLFDKLGAHPGVVDGAWGTHFAVWAPNAESVSLVGDFNAWAPEEHPMRPVKKSGIWETFAPGVGKGALYKFHIVSAAHAGYVVDKADPFAFASEVAPGTASIVADPQHRWGDGGWMRSRSGRKPLAEPMSIYELHLGGFQRVPEEGQRTLTYRELVPRVLEHVQKCGYSHVEILPVMEHPFYGSWGYQVTGYFAATRRYGPAEDLMVLIDRLHQAGVGVILDWVPSHFPSDEHGLVYFDGSHLFEHADPRRGWHPDWNSSIFDYGRREVRSFLKSSAHFWIDRFHADGLRVDGVASMLYLDYSRKEGEWEPNERGGRENLEAIELLRQLNDSIHEKHPDVVMIAEESTAFPMVSRPTAEGGLGFDLKWDLGWMHDTLRYLQRDPIHRQYHHQEITFRPLYAFDESFVLPLGHDEVVHGKGSLINKMPGDRWQKFATLRLLLSVQHAQPGKKLLFMGGDFAQWREWNHDASLDWHLAEEKEHAGILQLVSDLNRLHKTEHALHQGDCDAFGFKWIDGSDATHGIVSFLRVGGNGEAVACVFNFTPVPRYTIPVGVPTPGPWAEILNTDAEHYGGSGVGNLGAVIAREEPRMGHACTMEVTLPPLACVMFRPSTSTSTSTSTITITVTGGSSK